MQYLNLKRNNLRDTTGICFLEAVKINKVIETLILAGNSISMNFTDEI